ncbi:MAG: phosphatase PAP2 family protein [Planctomycetaceae bacterium]|jgi:membrane-associated phospholipid phosphatase|nr:phosphatase PAP2 family protein [Planctomycetaceae bacterium]
MIRNILQFVFVVLCGIILAVICNRFLDYPISSWFCANKFNIIEQPQPNNSNNIVKPEQEKPLNKYQNKLTKWILLFEFFGHPLCFLTVLILCFFIDVYGRCRLFRFLTSVLISQAIVITVKLSVYRKRPEVNDFNISSFDLTGFLNNDGIHSFPSGHTALAVVIALCLSSIYPRGRYVFCFAVLGVAFERIFDCKHYLSDTIVGGLISYVVWFFCYKFGFITGKFNDFESARKLDTIQNNRNDNNQPSILFGKTSLGSASGNRFSSKIRQFLHKDDKLLEQLEAKTNPNENNENKNNENKNKNDENDKEYNKELSDNQTPQLSKRSRRRNDLPFNFR